MTGREIAAISSACALTFAAIAFTSFRLCCWAAELLDHSDENGTPS